ncbi:hypothetical protein [Actinomadura keratinilytica]|uniref:hypothetical protein n=1 Tax=Actinomadura keratinilytica TaxID=547461 RepID=UPI00360E1A68
MTVFDRLVDQAWPAAHVEDAHGWRLRYAYGVTKRANSVWAAAEPPIRPPRSRPPNASTSTAACRRCSPSAPGRGPRAWTACCTAAATPSPTRPWS